MAPRENGHVHEPQKRSRRFVDYCHYVMVEQTCKECGEVYATKTERDFTLNPLQIAFARSDCPRCWELAHGMEPASWSDHA